MLIPPRRVALATTLMLSSAIPASAEITPAEVWADWQRLIANYGATVTVGSEADSGDILRLENVAIEGEFPEDEGGFATTIAEIVFENRGDGTVEITSSPDFPLAVSGVDETTDETFSVSMLVSQPSFVTIASRDGDTTRYDYLGPELSASIEGLTLEDEPVDFNMNVALSGMNGSYEVIEGTPRLFTSRMTADAMNVAVSGTDPEDQSAAFSVDLELSEIVSDGSGTIVGLAGFTDMSAMFAEGFQSEWSLVHGAATYEISGTDEEGRFNLDLKAETGDFSGDFGSDGLSYGGGNTGIDVAVSGDTIPFPQLTFAMAESEVRIELPVQPGEEADPFALRTRLIGLEISEALWGMFDPGALLPRDPANLVIDLSGQGRWLVDVFDPELSDSVEDMPGEIETVSVDALELTVAGASLTGDGAFVFDNSGTGPFAPAPSPSGTANFRLTGGNTLLDALVGMGLVPQDQAMGARMMLGLFARPGDGPDTLVSEIVVGEDGSISANGQRIR